MFRGKHSLGIVLPLFSLSFCSCSCFSFLFLRSVSVFRVLDDSISFVFPVSFCISSGDFFSSEIQSSTCLLSKLRLL